MKKSIGLLSLVAFIFVTLFAGSAFAKLDITWFSIQNRTYEDGRAFIRVVFEVNDPALVSGTVDLYEGDNPTPIRTWNSDNFELDNYEYGSVIYKCNKSAWNWPEEISWIGNVGFYMDLDFEPLNDTLYKIDIDWDDGDSSGTTQAEITFNDIVDLPIISLLKVNKKKDFLDDGSMVVRWDAPAVTHENTSLRVYVTIMEETVGNEHFSKFVYITQPTHMGMLIIPPDAIAGLQNDSDYNGFFDFQVQVRTNDNCNRAYSNVQRYYFTQAVKEFSGKMCRVGMVDLGKSWKTPGGVVHVRDLSTNWNVESDEDLVAGVMLRFMNSNHHDRVGPFWGTFSLVLTSDPTSSWEGTYTGYRYEDGLMYSSWVGHGRGNIEELKIKFYLTKPADDNPICPSLTGYILDPHSE